MGDAVVGIPLVAHHGVVLILNPGAVQGIGHRHTVAGRGVVGGVEEIIAVGVVAEAVAHRVILGVHNGGEVELLGGVVLIVCHLNGIAQRRKGGEIRGLQAAGHLIGAGAGRAARGLGLHIVASHRDCVGDGQFYLGLVVRKHAAGTYSLYRCAAGGHQRYGNLGIILQVLSGNGDGHLLFRVLHLALRRECHRGQSCLGVLRPIIAGKGFAQVTLAHAHSQYVHITAALIVRAQADQVAAAHVLGGDILQHQFAVHIYVVLLCSRINYQGIIMPGSGVQGFGAVKAGLICDRAIRPVFEEDWIVLSGPIDTDGKFVGPPAVHRAGEPDSGLHCEHLIRRQGRRGSQPGIGVSSGCIALVISLFNVDIAGLLHHRSAARRIHDVEVVAVGCCTGIEQIPQAGLFLHGNTDLGADSSAAVRLGDLYPGRGSSLTHSSKYTVFIREHLAVTDMVGQAQAFRVCRHLVVAFVKNAQHGLCLISGLEDCAVQFQAGPGQLPLLAFLYLYGVDNIGMEALAALVKHMPVPIVILDKAGCASAAIVRIGLGIKVIRIPYALRVIEQAPLYTLVQLLSYLKGIHIAVRGMTDNEIPGLTVHLPGHKPWAGQIGTIELRVNVGIHKRFLHRSPADSVAGIRPADVAVIAVICPVVGDHHQHNVLVVQPGHLIFKDAGIAGLLIGLLFRGKIVGLHTHTAIGPVQEIRRCRIARNIIGPMVIHDIAVLLVNPHDMGGGYMGDIIIRIPFIGYHRIPLILHPGAVQRVGRCYAVPCRSIMGGIKQVVAVIAQLIVHRMLLCVHNGGEVELLSRVVPVVFHFNGISRCGKGGQLRVGPVCLYCVSLGTQRAALYPGLHIVGACCYRVRDRQAEFSPVILKHAGGRHILFGCSIGVYQRRSDLRIILQIFTRDRNCDSLRLLFRLLILGQLDRGKAGLLLLPTFIGGKQAAEIAAARSDRLDIHIGVALRVGAEPNKVAPIHGPRRGVLRHLLAVHIQRVALCLRVRHNGIIVPNRGIHRHQFSIVRVDGDSAALFGRPVFQERMVEIPAHSDRKAVAAVPCYIAGQTDGRLQRKCRLRHINSRRQVGIGTI